jgi:hypothetical protein
MGLTQETGFKLDTHRPNRENERRDIAVDPVAKSAQLYLGAAGPYRTVYMTPS